MKARVVRLFAAMAMVALLFVVPGVVSAQRVVSPSVTPRDGVPGVEFVFVAPGFRGAVPARDAKDNAGERISYWINLPNGQIISAETHDAKGNEDAYTEPFEARANGYGEVTIFWRSPLNALAGPYSLVMHGSSSGAEAVLPFTIHPNGWQTVVQSNVRPAAGTAGTAFTFIATDFGEAAVKDNKRGEQVAYWFNTPDGKVISTEPRSGKTDYGSKEKPLLHYADEEGTVNLVWSSPTTLAPGTYSVVFHGLNTQREVIMYFTIR